MNAKKAKKLRRAINAQSPDAPLKRLYRALKDDYDELNQKERERFFKNLSGVLN